MPYVINLTYNKVCVHVNKKASPVTLSCHGVFKPPFKTIFIVLKYLIYKKTKQAKVQIHQKLFNLFSITASMQHISARPLAAAASLILVWPLVLPHYSSGVGGACRLVPNDTLPPNGTILLIKSNATLARAFTLTAETKSPLAHEIHLRSSSREGPVAAPRQSHSPHD